MKHSASVACFWLRFRRLWECFGPKYSNPERESVIWSQCNRALTCILRADKNLLGSGIDKTTLLIAWTMTAQNPGRFAFQAHCTSMSTSMACLGTCAEYRMLLSSWSIYWKLAFCQIETTSCPSGEQSKHVFGWSQRRTFSGTAGFRSFRSLPRCRFFLMMLGVYPLALKHELPDSS